MVRLTSNEGGVMSKEFDFFGNPLVSKLFDLILELGMDLHVASTRIHALEMQLVRNGNLKQGELDGFSPTDSERTVLDRNRDELMSRLMRIITEAGPSEHPLRKQWDEAIAKRSEVTM
jgi:hypothetical protein